MRQRTRDWERQVLLSGNLLWMAGMSVLMIDLRNSGDSDRKSSGSLDYTFGLLEYKVRS